MTRRPLGLLLATLLLVGCFGTIVQVTGQPKPEPPPPPVPERFKAEQAPELVPSQVPGCQLAPSLDPNLYYCEKQEHWFRFAMNRWFLAFAWDGNWFPVGGSELPAGLAKITPETEVEATKTREQRLEELEKKLEELDGEQEPP
ncbi:MAG: hypothetical protein WEF50_01295 [Myxococcota bacterium]